MMPESKVYIATFLRHSKQYLEDGKEVDVLIKDNNPHQGEKGDLATILSWKEPDEEIELTPVEN
jgi:hypothetical protein